MEGEGDYFKARIVSTYVKRVFAFAQGISEAGWMGNSKSGVYAVPAQSNDGVSFQ